MTNTLLGFSCVAISLLFFGSMLLATKRYPTGDGIFFQWVVCTGILLVGIVAQIADGSPPFVPFAMLGGACWAAGNALVVPTVKCIGLGLGMLIWSGANMIVGWTIGRFGLFGTDPSALSRPGLNLVGVLLGALSLLVFFFVKPDDHSEAAPGNHSAQEEPAAPNDLVEAGVLGEQIDVELASRAPSAITTAATSPAEPDCRNSSLAAASALRPGTPGSAADAGASILRASSAAPALGKRPAIGGDAASWVDRLSPWQRRAAGIGMALLQGLFRGCNFTPPAFCQSNALHLIDPSTAPPGWRLPAGFHAFCPADAPTELRDYAFAHYTGAWLAGTCMLAAYALATGNRPQVFSATLLPALVAGCMWGVAQYAFFISSAILSIAISYPLTAFGPAFVSVLWGVLLFKEVSGRHNLLLLGLALAIAATAAVCISMSMA